ncbi:MAG: 50S ribosomal protein L22 [Geminicoccaceae bacterium]|jgi:large subunit ribosomal protein L22|nr:50S ribosomal protein L22 [Geminicoccaceae bacterium]HRY24526.1 50S ribosomal protein L22 [Geminicoccaceae bacterium]
MGKPKQERRLADNEAMAVATLVRSSPQKLGLLAGMINGMKVDKALVALEFNRKRVSEVVFKALQSAVANAENNHALDVDRLYVAEASVGKRLVMKRFKPRARGRAGRVVKHFSQLRIVVQERAEQEEAA